MGGFLNTEGTHNNLKFAHRSKHVEIKASQNKIINAKSLIKKHEKEISSLKQALRQLKRGMKENPYMLAPNQEDLNKHETSDFINMKLQALLGRTLRVCFVLRKNNREQITTR